MAEILTNTKNKRSTLTAVILSLIMTGLGQVYCGRLVRGLIFNILGIVSLSLLISPFSIFKVGITITPWSPQMLNNPFALMLSIISFSLLVGIIQIAALIDSICLAKSAGADYKLKEYNKWYVYLILIILGSGAGTIAGADYVRGNVIELFKIPTAANYPTILPDDRILANKIAYEEADPKRGDIVVFLNPENREKNYIRRVVAVAGDTVSMKDNQLYINGQMLQRQPISQSELVKIKVKGEDLRGDAFYEINGDSKYKVFFSKSPGGQEPNNFSEITVPKYNCFVLGDNRNSSKDSRDFGPVPMVTIKGRADWLYWAHKDWLRFSRLDTDKNTSQ
jgi:signal peptidase I